jgi:hypothetical protein
MVGTNRKPEVGKMESQVKTGTLPLDAKTALRHIGATTFHAVRGSNPVHGEKFVAFQVGSKRGVSLKKLVITLNGSDLYDVQFVAVNTRTWTEKVIAEATDIFAESLSDAVWTLAK